MSKIKDFLNELNITLAENTSIDISDLNKKILSFNHKTNCQEWQKILKVIRKPNAKTYIVKTTNNEIECTLDHKFSTNINGAYKSLEELINEGYHNLQIVAKNGYESIIGVFPTNKRKAIYDLEVENTHNLFTNGLLSHNSMGDPTTVSGGKAIPFYAHGRVRITRSEIDRELQQNKMKFTIIKNKMAAPFKVGTVIYKWNKGFDFFSEVGELAVEFQIIKKIGNSYFLPNTDIKLVGKKKLFEHLEDNPEYTKQVLEPLVLDVLDNKETIREEDDAADLMQ